MKYTLLKKIVAELKPLLVQARISKIHQPEAELFVLRLWTGHENLRLLISVKSGDHRLHLTTKEWLNPQQPPRFCQLLRSRITRIDQVSLVNEDRLVQFDCHGPKGVCHLIVEMTGAIGNLVLMDEHSIIVDVLKRDPDTDSDRPLRAGVLYHYPDQNKKPAVIAEVDEVLPAGVDTWNAYVEQQQCRIQSQDSRQGFHQRLCQCIARQQKKLSKRLEKITTELTQQQGAEQFKVKGDLLLSSLYRINKGMKQILLPNFFSESGEELSIDLDVRLSPQQNAQSYFNRYKKARRGIDHSLRRIEETRLEQQWLEELDYQLEDQASPAELETIAAELDSAGLLKLAGEHHKKRTLRPSEPHEITTPSGLKILRGRNNQQNDALSSRHLKAGDLWFHAHNCPGAHVVLKASVTRTAVIDDDILKAAAIAAGYSKARQDSKVEVMMATADAVSRPKGARPGLVTVKKYKTLIVEPYRPS